MRTTIDLDQDLHEAAVAEARLRRMSLSRLLNDALRAALHPVPAVEIDSTTGLGVVHLGRPITESELAEVLYGD